MVPGREANVNDSLGVSPTVDGMLTCYRVAMKGRKIPHLRVVKPYPPTFGCSVCPATFDGPKTRKGLAKEFADHIRREHPRSDPESRDKTP